MTHTYEAAGPGAATSNIRMHLTGYSGLRPLPPAGDAGR